MKEVMHSAARKLFEGRAGRKYRRLKILAWMVVRQQKRPSEWEE